ncbi:MAG: family 43 glycosylhydrolase [Bacillota bacterium]|nr:family 43 glycosylhydrolase [Bacillota bacterium]
MLKNGETWYDTEGNTIHAHGGYIINYEGFYYWYGEDRRDNIYVSCYRSKDLKTWEFRNHVLTTNSPTEGFRIKTHLNLTRPNSEGSEVLKVNIERPKVLYNEKTKKFVMWAHYENGVDYHRAAIAIASCDKPDGDFVYHGYINPYGYMSRDCTLFKDDNGDAYFISSSRDNEDMQVYRLAEDYMNVDEHVRTLFQSELREAPAVFKKDGKYFILTSWCTGWAPNQGTYAYSDKIDGRYSINENFGDENTFFSQPAFVLPVEREGVTKYLYFGDRWGGSKEAYFTSTYIVLEIRFDKNGMPYIEYDEKAAL